eukprot:TRINITY_DN603_c0_g2_i10.p2 TRINITY_DN603_c0_g2~~TRINITY_DN603_c0_g2_i10.p2  ORF type:complete len:141 (-),score=30.82 TRINITY_DN603_c0_g2_i10:126-548(-)
MDRGWFARVREYCNDYECPQIVKDLNGYGTVMAFAFVCGVGWIIAAILAFCAASNWSKTLAIISGIIFLGLYIVFLGLFATTWHSVKKVDDDCWAYACDDFKKKAKRSSREFLAYSICGFILILLCIFFTLIPGFSMRSK